MEFFAITESLAEQRFRSRGHRPVVGRRSHRTAFGNSASTLGCALHAMDARIKRIGRLASKSSLFDDPAAEITESANAVRREMAAIGLHLEKLAKRPRQGRQFQLHSDVVLTWLHSRLNSSSTIFKGAVKQREADCRTGDDRNAGERCRGG